MVILLVMLAVHLIFGRTYSGRIKQFDTDVFEMDSIEDTNDEDLDGAIMDRVKISARIGVDRTNNNHAIIINCICIGGLSFIFALGQADKTLVPGLTPLLLLPIPTLLMLYHMHNILTAYIKRSRLLNMLSKLQ